jgi:hypothetical protein
MAYPLGTPYSGSAPSPAYSGTFIPEIWSGKMIEKFYDATVIGQMANTNYEGEIKGHGDKVNIRTKPSISLATYSADQALAVTRPSSNVVDLLIDKGYYWNTVLDDVMEVQSDLNQLSMWADDASEQMKIQIDTEVLATIVTQHATADSGSVNRGATAGRISANLNLGVVGTTARLIKSSGANGTTEANAIDFILEMGQVLDEQNIPETGRWVVLPAWYITRLKKSELRDASLAGDGVSMLRNGRVGVIDRFTIYSSNLLPVATARTTVYAGHSHGLTFASQLSKVETLRAESTFGTLLRGLQVYGRQVIDYRAIAVGCVGPA